MRFKAKQAPNPGDTRVIKRCLLLPHKLNGERRWGIHEDGRVIQLYDWDLTTDGMGAASWKTWHWKDVAWFE